MNKLPRSFRMVRSEDVTGVSGVGVVAEGTVFSDGVTVIRWFGDSPSTVVWPNLEAAQRIHGHGGKTEFQFAEE